MILRRWCLIMLGAALVREPSSYADGVSTTYADVVVDHVKAGHDVPMRDGDDDLELLNLGATPIEVTIQALIPEVSQVKAGSLPLPHLNWVHLEPATLRVAPHAKGRCRVSVDVPPERSFRDRWYQVMIWSRAQPEGQRGATIAAGLLSRVRFHVD